MQFTWVVYHMIVVCVMCIYFLTQLHIDLMHLMIISVFEGYIM